MAKSKVDIEQEYQDVLKVSTSLVGSLNQMIDDTAASQGRISDAAKKYNEQLKSIISNAAEEEELTEGVNKLLNERNSLAGRYFGANSRLLPQKQAELDVAISALKAEQSRIEVIGMVDNAAQELKSTLDSALDGILSGLNDIPVLGGLLSSIAKGPVESLKNSIGTAAQMFVTDFATGIRGGMKGMQALKMAGGNAFKFIGAAMNPVGIAIIAIGAALAVGIAGFVKLAAAASKFREETGLTNSQMGNMQNTIQNVYTNTASLGASMDEIAQAAADFTNEFHGIETPSEAVVTSMVALNKNFGIATGDAAKLNKVFQDMSGLTAEQAQHLLSSTVQMANMAGVAPSRVIKDLAATLAPGQPVYTILYAAAIIFFCFFYTALVFNSRDTADNLKKSGAFVPGIRPGDQTGRYIDKILIRLTLAGAIYMVLVCLLPEFLVLKYNVPFYFGGTSLLIIVVVAMDFMAQVQSFAMQQQYGSLMKKANFKMGA